MEALVNISNICTIQQFQSLGVCSEKREKDTNSQRYTPMFIAALFTIAKIWKQPKGPSTGERIKKMWCIFTFSHKKE